MPPRHLGICPKAGVNETDHVLRKSSLRQAMRTCDICHQTEPEVKIGASCVPCDVDFCDSCLATRGRAGPTTRTPTRQAQDTRQARFDVPDDSSGNEEVGQGPRTADTPGTADEGTDGSAASKKRKNARSGCRARKFRGHDVPFEDPAPAIDSDDEDYGDADERKERYNQHRAWQKTIREHVAYVVDATKACRGCEHQDVVSSKPIASTRLQPSDLAATSRPAITWRGRRKAHSSSRRRRGPVLGSVRAVVLVSGRAPDFCV